MILFIGDDDATRTRVVQLLIDEGYRTRGVTVAEVEENRPRTQTPALVVVDAGDDPLRLAALLDTLSTWSRPPRSLLLTGSAWAERLARAKGIGCARLHGSTESLLVAVVASLARGARARSPRPGLQSTTTDAREAVGESAVRRR